MESRLLVALGRLEDVMALVRERHLKLPPAEARKNARDLARALFHAERWVEALPVLREAARTSPETYPTFVGLESLAAFRLGDTATARRIDEELRTTRSWLHGEHTCFRACLATLRGEKAEAVSPLAAAIEQGWPNPLASHVLPVIIHADVNLEPRRGYPPFEERIKLKV